MLLSKSEELQYAACKCMISFVLENKKNQILVVQENLIEIILKLLRTEKIGLKVVLVILRTISALCVDIANVNNANAQLELVDKGIFDILVPILEKPPSKIILIEAVHAIACILLGNEKSEEAFNYKINLNTLINLLNEDDLELRLNAGKALSILAYNNKKRQKEIKILGGICFSLFEEILKKDEMQVCMACFQVKSF